MLQSAKTVPSENHQTPLENEALATEPPAQQSAAASSLSSGSASASDPEILTASSVTTAAGPPPSSPIGQPMAASGHPAARTREPAVTVRPATAPAAASLTALQASDAGHMQVHVECGSGNSRREAVWDRTNDTFRLTFADADVPQQTLSGRQFEVLCGRRQPRNGR